MLSLSALCRVSAIAIRRGTNSVRIENRFIRTKNIWIPCFDLGSGPTKSAHTVSHGSSGTCVTIFPLTDSQLLGHHIFVAGSVWYLPVLRFASKDIGWKFLWLHLYFLVHAPDPVALPILHRRVSLSLSIGFPALAVWAER